MASRSSLARFGALPVAGLSAALVLASCAGGADPAPDASGYDGIELTVWNNIDFDPYQTLQQEYFESCAADLGITVSVETLSGDYTTSLLQAAGSQTLPDISLLSTDTQLPQLASQGVLADLGGLGLSTDGLDDTVIDLGTYDGTLYGLPVQVEDYALFYNVEAFEAAGIDSPPETFDELVETASALTTDDQYGIALPGIAGDGSTSIYFTPFLLSAGGDPADPTSDGAVEAVDLYKQLVEDGSLSNEFVNWGWDSIDQWTSGSAAITVSGPWNLVDSSIDFEYGTFAFPTPEAGGTPRVALLGYAYGIAAHDDESRVRAAADLLACRAEEERQLDTAVQGGYIPALTSAQDAFVAEVPAAESFVEAVPDAWNPAELGTEWNALQQQYVDALQDATVNGESAEEALRKAAQG